MRTVSEVLFHDAKIRMIAKRANGNSPKRGRVFPIYGRESGLGTPQKKVSANGEDQFMRVCPNVIIQP
jgi:hypothetical protein